MKQQAKKKSKAKYSAARAASNKKLTAHDGGDVSRANIVAKIERMKRQHTSIGWSVQGELMARYIKADDLIGWIKKMPARYARKAGGL